VEFCPFWAFITAGMENTEVVNLMSVRSKPVVRKQPFRIRPWLFAGAAILTVGAGALAFGAYSGMIGILVPEAEIVQNGASRIIKVPPGGSVQSAIDRAEGGDIVELQAGAVYLGGITLPNKPITGFITIQSSAAASLPVDKRVDPQQRASMATLATRKGGQPAVATAPGAHHYRFVGIEFTATTADFNSNLIEFGTGEPVAKLPHDIEIDRSYLHPFRSGVVRRGIALNSGATTIKNSYIEGFGFPGVESQGICGWTGTRNIKILNNYIEGGAENIMFGGGDPTSADLIPVDIEVRGNHLNKPENWAKTVSVKTLFELKNAKRVQFVGNLLTNNWEGAAFRITIRNQDNTAPFSTIEDVLIKDNVIDRAGDGINILGQDDIYASQVLKRLTIENNLFTNIGDGGNVVGSGYFLQVADGEDITIANNTVFNRGNITSFHRALPRRFSFRDNIVGHGDYGIHGLLDLKSEGARVMYQKNIIINLNRVETAAYAFPSGNVMLQSLNDVGFANPAAKDFRLTPTSRFKGKGSNLPFATE